MVSMIFLFALNKYIMTSFLNVIKILIKILIHRKMVINSLDLIVILYLNVFSFLLLRLIFKRIRVMVIALSTIHSWGLILAIIRGMRSLGYYYFYLLWYAFVTWSDSFLINRNGNFERGLIHYYLCFSNILGWNIINNLMLTPKLIFQLLCDSG